MNKQFEILKKTRIFLLNYITDLSVEQLNKIPDGFRNNIVWHLGHIIAAQQGVCYRRGGLPLTVITDQFFELYKPDTVPENILNEIEINHIKYLLLGSIVEMELDYYAGKFSNIKAWTNRYDIALNNIDETIEFLMVHDGLNIGCIMTMKKIV